MLRESNEGDPFIKCYEFSVPVELVDGDVVDNYRRHYPLTLGQGEFLKGLGASFYG